MKLVVTALAVTLTLEVQDDTLARVVGDALTDLRTGSGDGTRQSSADVVVTGSGPWCIASPAHTATARSPERALSHVLTAVNLTAVAETPLLAFHAAVLADGRGTLVIPGRSGVGKSTLTACLLRLGWSYVSDEALALDWSTGALLGYPRPLGLSAWSCAVADHPDGLPADEETVVRASGLGADVVRQPPPVRHVVLLDRGSEGAPDVTTTDRNDALAELLQRGFTHHQDGGRALQLLVELLQAATVLRLRLSDPRPAAQLLTAVLRA